MMSDNYTHDELIRRGLAEMAYERDLEAQTARADELAAEVERLTAENAALRGELSKWRDANATLRAQLDAAEADRDAWNEAAEASEDDLGRFMDDLIAIVGDHVIVGDEVQFSAITAAVAALRAQLDAGAGEG